MDFNMEKFSFSFFLFVFFFFFFSFTFSFFYEVDDSIHFACAFHLKFLILNCKCLTNSLATYWNRGIQTDVRLKKDIPQYIQNLFITVIVLKEAQEASSKYSLCKTDLSF